MEIESIKIRLNMIEEHYAKKETNDDEDSLRSDS